MTKWHAIGYALAGAAGALAFLRIASNDIRLRRRAIDVARATELREAHEKAKKDAAAAALAAAKADANDEANVFVAEKAMPK